MIYSSPHLTEHPYSGNGAYSDPVNVTVKGLSIAASSGFKSRLQLGFLNNDRNLQILTPLSFDVMFTGADTLFVRAPAPAPPPPPLPPTPPPPATHTPWMNIGPKNIGDDINGGGEAGTIAPAVSPFSNPKLMYIGGNNNAASSGVLRSEDMGRHWTKVNTGLFDTRLQGPSRPRHLGLAALLHRI